MKEVSRDRIREVSLQAGWQAERVDRALEEYAEIDFPLLVPRPKPCPYLSARETFLYLLLFVALYVSTFNFGNLLFTFIEQAFPDLAMTTHSVDRISSRIKGQYRRLLLPFLCFSTCREKLSMNCRTLPRVVHRPFGAG